MFEFKFVVRMIKSKVMTQFSLSPKQGVILHKGAPINHMTPFFAIFGPPADTPMTVASDPPPC